MLARIPYPRNSAILGHCAVGNTRRGGTPKAFHHIAKYTTYDKEPGPGMGSDSCYAVMKPFGLISLMAHGH